MTLKTSYFKWLKEDWKRRRWTIVVFGILCFIMTVSFEMTIESYEQGTAVLSSAFVSYDGIENIIRYSKIYLYLLCSGMGAMLFGIQGFSWLMKKEQVDFYHSQPMKREKRFLLLYLDGIFLYECMMILHTIILAALIGIRGYLCGATAKCMIYNLCAYSAIFLLIYSIAILAVMLTGNLIVSFMASGTLLFYFSMIKVLVDGYSSLCFQTYTSAYDSGRNIADTLDPFQAVVRVIQCLTQGVFGETVEAGIGWNAILQAFFLSIVPGVLAFLLYKRRPSECAERALAFPILGDVIRLLLVIPVSMIFGLCLSAFQAGDSEGWLYFGTILGAVLMHGFMEVVFQSDIRACLGKKKQLLLSILLAVGISSVFRYDLLGYDSYLPKEEDLEEVSYSMDMAGFVDEYNEYDYGSYYKLNEEGVPLVMLESKGAVDWGYSESEYHLLKTATEETEPVLDLVKAHIEKQGPDYNAEQPVLVCYKLKSGREIYRHYYMDVDKLKAYFAALYETQQGKEAIYPYLYLAVEKANTMYALPKSEYEGDVNALEIKGEERKELLACYQKDIEENTFEELCNSKILGEISFDYPVKNSKEVVEIEWVIADSYENTLSYLKERGIEMK